MERKERQPIRYEPQERVSAFILRLPERYVLTLDALVEQGAAKSRNDLIVEIIDRFISNLQKKAQEEE